MKSAKEWMEILRAVTDDDFASLVPAIVAHVQRDALDLDVPGGDLLSEERLKEIEERQKRIEAGNFSGRVQFERDTEGAYFDYVALLPACRRALALLRDLSSDNATEVYRAGWEARVTYGEWMTLGELPKGALFETKAGVRAVKSEYHYGNEPGSQCQCVLLESGEYAHFPQRNKETVREIRIEGVTR